MSSQWAALAEDSGAPGVYRGVRTYVETSLVVVPILGTMVPVLGTLVPVLRRVVSVLRAVV